MKSKPHGHSIHSHSSTNLKSQPPSKSKKPTNPPPKSSQSFYQQIYRLPSSMKRTEEMISKSILKQHISSRILDLVGNTFRVKNAIQSQVPFPTRNPNPTSNRPRPSYSRDNSSSRILEVLYEEDGEDEDEEIISTVVNSTDRNNLSVRGMGNDYLERSAIMNKSVGAIKVQGNNSISAKNLQRIVACGNKNSNVSMNILPKHWEHERNSVSPGRRDLVKSDLRTVGKPRKSVEKPSTGGRMKSEERKAIVNNSYHVSSQKKISVTKESKKNTEKSVLTLLQQQQRSKENENNIMRPSGSVIKLKKVEDKGQIINMNEKKILQARAQSQEKKVSLQEIIKEEDEGMNMPRAVQKDYYSSVGSGNYKCQTEESTSEEIIKQTREALEKVLAPRVSKEENMKFSIYKSINDFEKKLSGHAMMRYNNLRKCLDSEDFDIDMEDHEEYRIKKVVGDF